MNFRLLSVVTLALFNTFTACKKDDAPADDQKNEISAHHDDQNNISNELDGVATEATGTLETEMGFSGRMMNGTNINSICGATAVADTMSNPRTVTITYNGNNCFGTHHRSGVVVLSMPAGTRWKNAGANITLNFQNFKIKRLTDNKSITINGSQTLTNVSGGLMMQLPMLGNITHTVSSSNMSIKFDDNTQRTWQIARKRVFTYNNGVVMTISGNHTIGNNTGVAEWGINRFGHAFTTSISQPLVFRQDCLGRLTSGEIRHEGFATATATFGLNSAGSPTTCPGAGATYYFKLSWTGPGGNSQSVILPY